MVVGASSPSDHGPRRRWPWWDQWPSPQYAFLLRPLPRSTVRPERRGPGTGLGRRGRPESGPAAPAAVPMASGAGAADDRVCRAATVGERTRTGIGCLCDTPMIAPLPPQGYQGHP